MRKYIIIRILLAIVTIFVFYSAVYLILDFTRGVRWTRNVPYDEILKIAFSHYKTHLHNVWTDFDWGLTMRGDDAWELVKERIPISMKINLIALSIYLCLGLVLGVLSAVYKDSIFDKLVMMITMFLGSIPTLVWVMVLIIIFGYYYRSLPSAFNLTLAFKHGEILKYIIPVFALCLQPISKVVRLVRSELIDTFESEYILLCKAKGLKRRQIVLRHNFRHILIILIPEISMLFMYTLLNSFFIEDVYNIDGIARMFLDGIIVHNPGVGIRYVMVDVNAVTVISVYIVTFTTVVILISDILMGVIDPRVRIHGKKV